MHSPSKELDQLYVKDRSAVEEVDGKERMLLTQKDVQTLAQTVDIPALQIEMERAIWQVEQALSTDGKSPVNKDTASAKSQVEDKKDQ